MGTICQWKVYDRGTFSVKNGMQKGKGLDVGGQGGGGGGFLPEKKLWLVSISRALPCVID